MQLCTRAGCSHEGQRSTGPIDDLNHNLKKMYFIQYVTFSFDGKFTSYNYLKKFRKICGKYREEMWEIKKRNLGEFPSNLWQGLVGIEGGKVRRNVPCVGMSVRM